MKKNLFLLMISSALLQAAPFERDASTESVTDIATGLVWQDDTPATKAWSGAITYCENLTLGGFSNWYLPNKNELLSIVDYNKASPSIDSTFVNTDYYSSPNWSATTNAVNTGYAWAIYFQYGSVNFYDKTNSYYVRCVRARQ